ncbi:MAG: DUF4126 domain-containing protein [Bacteroidota bacterium]
MEDGLQTALSVALGIGLSAAAGFRVFVPLLAISAASMAGYLELSPGFQWMGSVPALTVFATATVLEVLAYYIPWLDNALDAIATPAAVLAGVVASASVMVEMPPLLKWTLAFIAGGGIAGIVQGATALLRLKSTALTGGLGNPALATAELAGAVSTSALAILLPLVGLLLILCFAVLAFWFARRVIFGRPRSASQ